MDELVAFVRARLDEDAETAAAVLGTNHIAKLKRGIPAPRWTYQPDASIVDTGDEAVVRVKFTWVREAAHIARHDPARVLAEVEAKRDMLDHYERIRAYAAEHGHEDYALAAGAVQVSLRHLATAWGNHPDYQEKWRP